jgi:multiple sugar transport system permease protein
MLRQYFLTIPNDLEDAARVDGANIFRIYWNIMLPLVVPALAVLAILTFNGTWNEFFRPFIFIGRSESYTLPLALNALKGEFGTGSVAIILAGVVLALLPTLLLYIFSQRYLVEGIASSGIKG